MSSSLIYTNAFFFTFSAVIMLYLIDKPVLLTYKNGIPIFSLLVLILLRLIIPGEFLLQQFRQKIYLPLSIILNN